MAKDKHLVLHTDILIEAVKNGVDLSKLVPKTVENRLKEKFLIKELTL